LKPLDLLVVAAHPDDAEISVGGTILASAAQGLRVGVLDLTSGEPTPHGSPEKRAAETARATDVLGLEYRENLGLPNRSLQDTLDARRLMAGVFRQLQPRIILAPYWEDVHPDHVAASRLCDDARFWSKLSKTDMPGEPFWPPLILYYWSIHLRIHPKPSFVFDISEHIDRKLQAVRCYESQLLTGRSDEFPTVLDDIRDRSRYWGWTIGAAYAEPFASREEVGLSTFDAISQSRV
jgi:bacillithiol biosynthesis deacetylase BshB1